MGASRTAPSAFRTKPGNVSTGTFVPGDKTRRYGKGLQRVPPIRHGRMGASHARGSWALHAWYSIKRIAISAQEMAAMALPPLIERQRAVDVPARPHGALGGLPVVPGRLPPLSRIDGAVGPAPSWARPEAWWNRRRWGRIGTFPCGGRTRKQGLGTRRSRNAIDRWANSKPPWLATRSDTVLWIHERAGFK